MNKSIQSISQSLAMLFFVTIVFVFSNRSNLSFLKADKDSDLQGDACDTDLDR